MNARTWRVPLYCNCCALGPATCLGVTCCTPCVRQRVLRQADTLIAGMPGSADDCACDGYCLEPQRAYGYGIDALVRFRVRGALGILDPSGDDGCATSLCLPCNLVQLEAEIREAKASGRPRPAPPMVPPPALGFAAPYGYQPQYYAPFA